VGGWGDWGYQGGMYEGVKDEGIGGYMVRVRVRVDGT